MSDKMKKPGWVDEFKTFIMRGNVMDLAVGVIIGGAFATITSSLTNDIIMPLVGILTGGIDFSGLSIVVGSATLTYGNFINAVLQFLILAFAIFWMVKAVNKAMSLGKHEEEKPAEPEAPPAPTTEELLAEIRDLLKEKQ